LLTGPPGCGKTTVICSLVERLGDLRLAGFYTQEIREQGQRIGFEAVTLSGRRALLAHVRSQSRHRVGRYGVEPDQLEPLVQEELASPGAVDVSEADEGWHAGSGPTASRKNVRISEPSAGCMRLQNVRDGNGEQRGQNLVLRRTK
jgi:hypothetical protein